MAVVIACVNHKGGCAKTTTAVNLAVSLANGNDSLKIVPKKVLLIDLDPKGNVATTFGLDKKNIGLTMNELFKGEIEGSKLDITEYLIGPQKITRAMRKSWRIHNPDRSRGPPKNIEVKNIWILPADLDLSGIEIDLATRIGRENRLKIAISKIKNDFDLIIIDTPASLGLLTINALSASEWVLIPIQAEFYALEGMNQLMHSIRDVQRAVNPNLKLFGILLTMVQTRSKLCETVSEQARKHFGDHVFKTQIQRSVSIAESPLEGAPIVITQKPTNANQGSKAYWSLAKEADIRINKILNN